MSRRKMSGISTTALLGIAAGAAVLIYVMSRPKTATTPVYTTVPTAPVTTTANQYTEGTAIANDTSQTLNNLFNNIFG